MAGFVDRKGNRLKFTLGEFQYEFITIWVVHAFQKKSTKGVKTPKREIDLIKDLLKRLKEMLR